MGHRPGRLEAARIVRDAGGEIVGRTRLQKVAYLLELTGLGNGFRFEYRHYGPYSEELADAIHVAGAFDLVAEEDRNASWGGFYTIYRDTNRTGARVEGVRATFAEKAAKIDSIELELAATAAFLHAVERVDDPWAETERRKPEKAGEGRLERAKAAYRKLRNLETPSRLPEIA